MTTPPLSAAPQGQSDPAPRGWTPLLDALPQGVLLADASGRYVEANPAATRILGLERATLLASGPIEPRSNLLAADGSPLPAESTPAAMAFRTGTPVHGTILGWIREQQDPLWLELSAEPLPGGGVLVSFEDISARIQAETALKESEARWHSLVEQAGDGFELLDEEGRYLQVNEASCRNLGYSREDLLRMTLFEVDPALTPDTFKAQFQALIEKPAVTFETVHRRKDGTDFPAEVTASVIRLGEHYRAMAQVRDITTWKREHAALQDSEQRYRSLFERMTEGYAHCRMIYDGDEPVDWVYLAVNPAFEALTGLPHAMGRKVSEVIPGIRDSSPDLFEIYGRVARIGVPEQFETFVPALCSWFSVHVFSPGPDEFVATFENITERKHGEEVLIQSEERARASSDLLRSIFESPKGVIIFALDTSYRYTAFTESHQETMRAIWGVAIQPGMSMLGAISRPDDREKARRNFNRALQGEHFLLEEEYGEDTLHRNWWQNRYAPIYGPDGAVTGLTVFVIDITERRRAELDLQKAHEQLTLAQRSAGAGMWDWDLATEQLTWSPELFALFGLDPDRDAATFGTWKKVLHPEDVKAAGNRIAEAIAERKLLSSEYRIVLPGGGIGWIHALGSVIYDNEGRPARMAGICLDISGRKRMEEALAVSESRSRAMLRTAMDGVWLVDLEGRFIEVNEAACLMLGRTREELLNLSVPDVEAVESPEETRARIERLRRNGSDLFQSRHRRSDGTSFQVEVSTTFQPDSNQIVCYVRDITERKEAEAKAARWQQTFALSTLALIHSDPATNTVIEVNRAFAHQRGYEPEEMAGMPLQDLFPPEEKDRLQGYIQDINRVGNSVFEIVFLRKDGSTFPALADVALIHDKDGQPVSRIGYTLDITERKRAEEALLRFRHFFEQSAWGKVIADGDSQVIAIANSAFAQMHGYALDEMAGMPLADTFAPESRGELAEHGRKVHELGHHSYESLHLRKDGSTFPCQTQVTEYRDPEGHVLFRAGTFEDITERKQAESRLFEEKQRFQGLVDSVDGIVWEADARTFAFTYVSAKAERLLGYPVEDWKRQGFWADHIHPEDRDYAVQFCVACTGRLEAHDFEYRFQAKDGSYIWLRDIVAVAPDDAGQPRWLRGVMVDITERKRSEEALNSSEARLREAQHLAHIGHWVQDHRSGQVTWSEELYRVHGLDPSGPPPDWASFQERLHPEDRQRVKAAFEGHLKNRTPGFTAEFRTVLAGGEIRHLKVHIETEFDATGAPLQTLGTDQDITEQVAAREAIAKSEAGLATAQRISHMGSWEWDLVTNKVEWSAEMYRLFGLDPVRYNGTPEAVLKVVHPDDRAAFIQNMEKNLAQGETAPLEYRVVHPDGSVRTLFANGIIVFDRDGKPVKNIGTIQDITERKQAEAEHQALEAQLQRVQKMDSLGNLAGGVAHDMNNVLGAIMGLASLHEQQAAEGSTLRKSMETITKACLRGRSLVQGLLGFAREGLAEEKVVDLNALVADQSALLARTTLQKVNLVTELQDGLHPIIGDPSALSHVLMNLSVNAVDAMSEKGTLTIRTRNQGQAFVELEVEDTGTGMSAEVLAKATDPFFTTKPQGKGTGLGLSIVYGTVKAHRGRMDLRSAPGKGTTVTLHFPACAPQSAASESDAGVQRSARSLRVLVVDDDELLQASISWLLEALGHTHQIVASGEAALELLTRDGLFDAVILDLNMPGLGGEATLPRLRALRPELPVLLATGRADQQAVDLVERIPGVTLLAKPFTLEELMKQLAGMVR